MKMNIKQIKKIVKKAGKKKFLNILLSFVLAFNLVAFQVVYPFSVARALAQAEAAAEEVIEESEEDDKAQEEKEAEEAEETKQDNAADEEEADEQEAAADEPADSQQQADQENSQIGDSNDAIHEVSGEEAAAEVNQDDQDEPAEISSGSVAEQAGNFESQQATEVNEDTQKVEEPAQDEGEPGIDSANDGTISNQVEAVSDTGNNNASGSNDSQAGQEQQEAEVVEQDVENGQQGEESNEEQEGATDEVQLIKVTMQEEPNEEGVIEATNVSIDTGDAIAEANIVNEVNTNIVGTNWADSIINLYGAYNGDINLLEIFNSILELSNAQLMQLAGEISNTNEAQVNNTATADANSGNNTANGNEGDASITTGDADAYANVVNLINRNIVGENWLFAFINVFGDWTGDLIVPGQDLLTIPQSSSYQEVKVTNRNDADVENVVHSDADSGNNTADGNNVDVSVSTGEAISTSVVTNVLNTNIISNNWFSLAVNTAGVWMGSANNWEGEQGGGGMSIFQYLFGVDEHQLLDGTLTVLNFNSASIANFVSSFANTGDNVASENGGDVSITTGDANAFSSVTNFVNTNIVGNNWLFAFVNVIGVWEGDVEFAYPDLDITISDGKDSAQAGETLEYDVSFKNNGMAIAEDVVVTVSLASDDVSYSSNTSDGQMKISGSKYAWDLPPLKPGQSKSFKVKAKVAEQLSAEQSDIVALATIDTNTTERVKNNNQDSDKTTAMKALAQTADSKDEQGGYFDDEQDELDSNLKVKRYRTIEGAVRNGEIVYHAIIVENDGEGPVYDVKVRDAMFFAGSEKIIEYEWPIGDLAEGGKMLVEYQLLINDSAVPGIYNFDAKAKGEDPYDHDVRSKTASLPMQVARPYGNSIVSVNLGDEQSAVPLRLIPDALAADEGYVLGASTDANTCIPLPLWIWASALAAYALLINWSLFPSGRNKSKRQSQLRTMGMSALGTAGMIAFWLAFRCDAMLWFAISTFIILLAHLLIKKNTQQKHRARSELLSEEVRA